LEFVNVVVDVSQVEGTHDWKTEEDPEEHVIGLSASQHVPPPLHEQESGVGKPCEDPVSPAGQQSSNCSPVPPPVAKAFSQMPQHAGIELADARDTRDIEMQRSSKVFITCKDNIFLLLRCLDLWCGCFLRDVQSPLAFVLCKRTKPKETKPRRFGL
jgi:hypothetical protein